MQQGPVPIGTGPCHWLRCAGPLSPARCPGQPLNGFTSVMVTLMDLPFGAS